MSTINKIISYLYYKYIFLKYELVKIYRKIMPYRSAIKISSGTKCTSDKIALFSIHLNNLKIAEYIKLFTKELVKNGYDIILIISYDKSLDVRKVQTLVENHFESHHILLRGNYGKDFGGFKDALKYAVFTECKNIILLNDSIIGPIFPSNFLKDIDNIDGDVIGITDSYDKSYHLQSSFLKFSGSDNIKLLLDFFDNYQPSNHRYITVCFGELALSKFFIMRNKTLVPYVSSMQLWSTSGYKYKLEVNAQHAYWAELVFKYKVPFVKRELIVSDPSKFLEYRDERLSDESLDIIDDGLKFRLK